MDNIESFFCITFRICMHYVSSGIFKVVPEYERWNYFHNLSELAVVKLGTIEDAKNSDETLVNLVTDHYRSLIPCLSKLRALLFPGGTR
ncbi:hypothetical protein V8C42DRAFT_338425 [Trichoderma barbatum]